MTSNVGTLDRVLRVILGLALLSLAFVLEGNLRWIAVLGVPLLLSAAFGVCFAYRLFGLNTCPLARP
ncbi:MAG: DUF2892 domain-containing protein [Acetobacterales bacterium]